MSSWSEAGSLQALLDAVAQHMVSVFPANALLSISSTIARQAADNLAAQSLQAGSDAPLFTLPDAGGSNVSLASLLQRGPLILTFYRGGWCPYCDLTLRAYQQALPEFARCGASLVAISAQTRDASQATVVQKQLTFPVLSDTNNRVARQYGLVYRFDDELQATFLGLGIDFAHYNGTAGWELPLTGTFVVAQNGTIVLASVQENYMRRLDPQVLVAALATLHG